MKEVGLIQRTRWVQEVVATVGCLQANSLDREASRAANIGRVLKVVSLLTKTTVKILQLTYFQEDQGMEITFSI